VNHKGTVRLETERLVLRRFTGADAVAMFENWASDPMVARYVTWAAHDSIEISRQVIADWISGYEHGNKYEWAIELKDDCEVIGSIGAVPNDDLSQVHVGYVIGRPWWHRGYATEALTELIRFFFTDIGAKRIEAVHDPRNPNSGKVMQKAGMQYEGTLRQSMLTNDGELVDAVYYAIIADDKPDHSSGLNSDAGVDWVPDGADNKVIAGFWQAACEQIRLSHLGFGDERAMEEKTPDAWAFGDDPQLADDLLALVLAGIKTGTASALWDFEEGEPIPKVGDLSIILDGAGHPRAVIQTTAIDIVPFNQVSAEHASSEGEGDRTLVSWRKDHESFWRRSHLGGREFSETMPVLLERFQLLLPSHQEAAPPGS